MSAPTKDMLISTIRELLGIIYEWHSEFPDGVGSKEPDILAKAEILVRVSFCSECANPAGQCCEPGQAAAYSAADNDDIP